MSTRPHKCPVGTIRNWEIGQVIKAYDNSIFGSGWIPIPSISESITKLFLELDSIGKQITNFKDPIDGKTWLEKVINEWESPSGQKYSLDQFKQYYGFYGSAQYSFSNEFTKRYLSDKIELNAQINEELLRANKFAEELVDEKNRYDGKIYLSKEQIKEIKQRVKEEFKSQNATLDLRDPEDLSNQLTKVLSFLKQGEDLQGLDKEVYDKNKKIIDELDSTYIPLKEMKSKFNQAIEEINNQFKDNWGITRSFKNKALDKKSSFIRKYSEQIKEDELNNFEKELGCDILTKDINLFYSNLKKLENKLTKQIDLNDYIGKSIPDYRKGSYKDFTLKSIDELGLTVVDENGYEKLLINSYYEDEINTIKKKIASENIADIQIPLEIRFESLYGKALQGDWDFDSAKVLENVEKVFNYLPKSHTIDNPSFKKFGKNSFSNSGENTYAHFDQKEKEIFLSKKFIDSTSKFTDVNDGNHFASVIIHEIGHAVSFTLKRQDNIDYKRFGVECGWSWTDLKANKINTFATGDMKSVPRTGQNSTTGLITDYASKSPEEAFAEYYSFYQQHKSTINKYLQNKDSNVLKRNKEVNTSKLKLSDQKISDYFESNLNIESSLKIDSILYSQKIDIEDKKHLDVSISDAFKIKPSVEHNLKAEQLKNTINSLKKSTVQMPIIAVKNLDGNLTPIDENNAYLAKASFYLKKKVPVITISQEAYGNLINNEYNSKSIIDFITDKASDYKIPEIIQDIENKEGLIYDGNVIDYKIIEKNKNILQAMKKLVESEEFKKALENTFNIESENVLLNSNEQEELIQIEKSQLTKKSLFDLFKSYIVKPFMNKNQKYSDVILINEKGEFLILLRSNNDDFCPGQWTLPGGKIESEEDAINAAVRELSEETNINLEIDDLSHFKTIKKDDCEINYFLASIDSSEPKIILDNEEHQGYEWIKTEDIQNKDFLLDLKETLLDFFNIESTTFVEDEKIDDIEILKSEENNDIQDQRDDFNSYISNSFLYNDKLYDNEGFMIPLNSDDITQTISAYPSIYKVDTFKLENSDKSNKEIFDNLDRKRFDKVLPLIQEFETLFNNLLYEVEDKYIDSQIDFDKRIKNIKTIIKNLLNNENIKAYEIKSLLEYLKQNFNENVDPLLEVTENGETKQAYLSELSELLSTVEDEEDLNYSDINIVDFNDYGISDFKIQYFDKNNDTVIRTICNLVKQKLESKKNKLFNLKKSLDNNLITDEEYLNELFKAENSKEVEEDTQLTEEEIKEWARQTSLQVLESTIKSSDNEIMRKIAHNEINRRKKEEHINEEDDSQDVQKSYSNELNSKGCLMFFPDIDKEKWNNGIKELFDENKVLEFENEPHITILYGFLDDDLNKEELISFVNDFKQNNILSYNIKPISMFKNDERDVVKLSIEDLNGNLTKLNSSLKDNFKYENSFNDYKPHITLAYVEKDSHDYLNEMNLNLNNYGLNDKTEGVFIYSDKDKNHTII